MFRTESYEKALEFIAGNEKNLLTNEQQNNKIYKTESYEKTLELIAEINKQNLTATIVEQRDNKMNKTETSASPSTSSLKRRNSNDNNTIIEDYQPKKKRESAIRSENNLKMLIQSGQVDTNKQKVSPKKVLSLRKEVRTETLATLIKAQKFDKLAKLYSKTFAAESHGSIDNVETSDSETETETLPPLDKKILEPVTPNMLKPKNTGNVPNPTNETNVRNSTIVLNPTNTTNELNATNTTNILKPTDITNVPKPTNTINVPEPRNVPNLTNITNLPEPTNIPNPTNTTNVPTSINTTNMKPTNTKNVSKPTNTTNDPQSTSTTLVLKSTNTTNESKSKNTIDVPNPTITSNLPKSKCNKIVAIATSTTNVPELASVTKKDTFLHSNNYYSTSSKTPLPEAVDISISQISSTNNLDENKELETESNGSISSIEAEVLALHKLIRTLASDNSEKGSEKPSTVDIKHIEDMHNTVLAMKSNLNRVYREKGEKLRKSFENIQLIVPELKRGLTLPTLQELKERNQPKPLSPQQEQPSLSKERSSSSESEDSPSQSSNSFPKCTYVAKWTLRHKGPGSGLTEVMENTGIYIDEPEFIRIKLLATDMRNLARLLLPLIFSEEAMNKCSYTGYGPNGKRPKSEDAAPGLDEHARNVLMAFVNQYAKKSGWTILSPHVMNQSMRDKLRKFQLRNLTWKRVNDP